MIRSTNCGYRWHTVGNVMPIEFLKDREPYYTAACGRFLQRTAKDCIWSLHNQEGRIKALLIYSKRSFFPVFNEREDIPIPRFLRKAPIHAIQGLCQEVEILDTALAESNIIPKAQITYDLMTLDKEPDIGMDAGPPDLILRHPNLWDIEELFRLQAAYEQEEVLPQGSVFHPASCRLSLEHIIANEHILIAELKTRIVGKINTSITSFSRYQIGGVYVRPEYRNLGIATRMGFVFARSLLASGKGLTLFVKKRNQAAYNVYRRIGFTVLGDYRISYY